MTESIKKMYTGLTISIVVMTVSLIAIVTKSIENNGAYVAMAFLVSGFSYYVFLGILAAKHNRSPIIWVGLSILFSPFGLYVSYFMMMNLRNKRLPQPWEKRT